MAQGKLLNGTQLFEVSYVNHFKVECSGRSVLHSGELHFFEIVGAMILLHSCQCKRKGLPLDKETTTVHPEKFGSFQPNW